MPLAYACPYFIWEDTAKRNYGVHCECGTRIFSSIAERDEFTLQYCAHNPGWQHCSAAAVRTKMYEERNK